MTVYRRGPLQLRPPATHPSEQLPTPPEWMLDAACAEVDGDLWYPDRSQRDQAAAARRICGTCPVTVECLTYALDNNEQYGVWGGVTERDRRKLTRTRRCRACAAPLGDDIGRQFQYCDDECRDVGRRANNAAWHARQRPA